MDTKDHIPKEDYIHAFELWIQRLKKCVAVQGASFEKMQTNEKKKKKKKREEV